MTDRQALADRARLAVQGPLERQTAPLRHRALDALAARPGEHILDIGCGAGGAIPDLAAAVAPGGRVLAVDISPLMLDAARSRSISLDSVDLLQADAQTAAFAVQAFDAAYSSFGVMFFADPTAAFVNIRKALKPAGRVAFVCWRALAENELDLLPLSVASPYLPPQPPEDGPSPFSFANPDHLRAVLSAAGFQAIDIVPYDTTVWAGDLDETLALVLNVGALGKILRETPHLRAACEPAVRAALAARQTPRGVELNAAVWIVTAHK